MGMDRPAAVSLMRSFGTPACGTSRRRSFSSEPPIWKGGALLCGAEKSNDFGRCHCCDGAGGGLCQSDLTDFDQPASRGRLPSVEQDIPGAEGKAFLPVEVTPDTVQKVIASLSRPESYYRQLTVGLYWNGGSGGSQVEIWADGGYVRTAISAGDITQYRLVGDGKLRLWYAGDKTWKETSTQAETADLAQRIPTYEEVLALDPEKITSAAYEQKNDKSCIFVEIDNGQDGVDRYWIDTESGLLCAAESSSEDRITYEMTEIQLTTPLAAGVTFTLPNGMVLHETS